MIEMKTVLWMPILNRTIYSFFSMEKKLFIIIRDVCDGAYGSLITSSIYKMTSPFQCIDGWIFTWINSSIKQE